MTWPAGETPQPPAAPDRAVPEFGGERIARNAVEIAAAVPAMTLLPRTVNGQPGLIAQRDGVTVTVFAFDFTGDRISHLWAIRNPEKLKPWTAANR